MAFYAFWFFAIGLFFSGLMVIASRNSVHGVLYLILAFFNAAALMLILGAEFLAMLLVIVYVGAVAVLFLFVVMMLDIKAQATLDHTTIKQKAIHALGLSGSLSLYIVVFLSVFLGGFYAVQHFVPLKNAPYGMQVMLLSAALLFFLGRFLAHALTKISFFDVSKRFLKTIPLPLVLGFIIIGEIVVLLQGASLQVSFNQVHTGAWNPQVSHSAALGMVLFTGYLAPFLISSFLLLVAMVGAILLTLKPRQESKRQDIQKQLSRCKHNTLVVKKMAVGQGIDDIKGAL